MSRNVTAEERDPRERYSLYRLCDCPTCEGKGKALVDALDGPNTKSYERCPECRGEGKVRQEIATCESPEAVGVALVTLAREGEWEDCPLGLLDREPPCETCEGSGTVAPLFPNLPPARCVKCQGSGVKPTGTWLILPWMPSARNVSDAARTLAKSKNPRKEYDTEVIQGRRARMTPEQAEGYDLSDPRPDPRTHPEYWTE